MADSRRGMRARRGVRILRIVSAAVVSLALIAGHVTPASAVNRKQLQGARERYRRVQEQLNRLAEEYARQEERLDNLKIKISSTNRAVGRSKAEMVELQRRLQTRVRTAYRLGGLGFFDLLLSSGSFRDFSLRVVMLERESSRDEDLILKMRRVQAELASKQESLQSQKRAQSKLVEDLKRKAGAFQISFGQARQVLAGLEDQVRAEELARLFRTRAGRGGGSGRAVGLSRCPVPGPHAFSNDWGAPRGGGRRSHRGNDIFAPMGASAAAVVSGRVSRHGSGGLGGLSVYLWGDDGNEYYYAHMSGFAAPVGARVGAGQTIAYVGNTGNARGGAPHVHFEIHPGGGGAINPYSSLIRVC